MEHSFDVDIAKEYGIEEAILLKHIYYWVEKNRANGKNFYDGYYWTYNSIKAFKEMFPYMSEKKIRNALNKLIENDLIITGCYNSDVRDRTLWYAITEKGKSILPKSNLHFTERANDIIYNNNIINNTDIKQTNINTNINKENNISKDIFKESKKQKKKYGTYGMILLTDDEYNRLIEDFGKRYVEAMLEKLDEYVGMNNNKNGYKNFNLVMRKALKEEWFKLKKSDFDRISDDKIKNSVKYFETLYNTDIDKYNSELQFLDEDERKEIIKQVEYGGFDNI